MKKIISFVLSLLLVAFLLAPACVTAEEALTLHLTADKPTVARGGTVTVTVEATSNPGWNMFGATASFDKTAMTREGGVAYGAIGTGTTGINAVLDAGMEDTTATGVLFCYTVRVRDDAPLGDYTLGLTIRDGDVVSIDESDVPTVADTVTVTVIDPAAASWGQTLTIADQSGAKVEFTFDDVVYDPATGDVTLSDSFEKAHPDAAFTVTYQNEAGETVQKELTTPPAPPQEEKKPLDPGVSGVPSSSGVEVIAPAPADAPGNGNGVPTAVWIIGGAVLALIAVAVICILVKKKPSGK